MASLGLASLPGRQKHCKLNKKKTKGVADKRGAGSSGGRRYQAGEAAFRCSSSVAAAYEPLIPQTAASQG